jgi:hypothetical protein
MAHGLLEQAAQLLQLSGGGSILNTAFIERLNGTFRERLASLTRKSRHAAVRLPALRMGMYLSGCTYNFCVGASGIEQSQTLGRGLYSCHGEWLDRSCLESRRIVTV